MFPAPAPRYCSQKSDQRSVLWDVQPPLLTSVSLKIGVVAVWWTVGTLNIQTDLLVYKNIIQDGVKYTNASGESFSSSFDPHQEAGFVENETELRSVSMPVTPECLVSCSNV